MNLIGLSRAELQAELEKLGEKPFRAKQLWHWIYWQGKTDFAEMTSLGKPLREKLAADGYTLNRPEIIREQNAADSQSDSPNFQAADKNTDTARYAYTQNG